MLDSIIKSKNIIPSVIFSLVAILSIGYYDQITDIQIICSIILCALVLFYTKVSYLIKYPIVVNLIFVSTLILFGIQTIYLNALIANILVIIAFLVGRYLYGVNGRYTFVEVTLLVFVAILFYPPTVFYILFIYSLMLFHSIKRFSTTILPLYCLAYFFGSFLSVSYIIDFDLLTHVKNQFTHFELVYYMFTPKQLFLLISLGLLTLFALFDHYKVTFKQSIRNKKNYELILYFLIISSLLFFLSRNAILFILFPCSVLVSKYIYYQKNKWLKWFMILYFPVSALIWNLL